VALKRNNGRFKNSIFIFLILLCAGVVYFSYLGIPDNFAKREVRTVICAREMLSSGNYLIPTLGGETRFEKPPLQYWLISLSAKLNKGLLTNVSSRIPTVLAGILVLILTWWWTLRLLGNDSQRRALLSPLILIIIPLFFLDVRSSEAEVLLCFFILAASYFFWKASATQDISGKNLLIAYLFIGGGMLTKGPLALIMPLLPYIAVRKKMFLKEWKWHLLGLLITVIPVGLWVYASYMYYPDSIQIFIRELFTKRFGGEAKHTEPMYYYIVLLLGQFAIFVPLILTVFQKPFKKKPELKFSVYFILLNLIWLSFMSSKQRHYIEPLFPHISILLGVWLSDQCNTKWVLKYFNILSWVLIVAGVVFGFLLLPESIVVFIVVGIAGILLFVFQKDLPLPGLWKTALFFLALMHLSNFFVTYTGNRLLPEQLMSNWINNQPVLKDHIVFQKMPDELLVYYLNPRHQVVLSNEKDSQNTAPGYLFVEDKNRIEKLFNDNRFYLIKKTDRIKKGKKYPYLAVFGKTVNISDEAFHYSLLFLPNDRKNVLNEKEIASNMKLERLYAIVPEINPLESLSPYSINDRTKWSQTFLPLLNQGVELISQFDSKSSLFRKAWFHDASYWGVTPEYIQRRSFFNKQYSLWTINQTAPDTALNQLEDEIIRSPSVVKMVFFQRPSVQSREVSSAYIKKLKQEGAMIINEQISENTGAINVTLMHGRMEIQPLDLNGHVSDPKSQKWSIMDTSPAEIHHSDKKTVLSLFILSCFQR